MCKSCISHLRNVRVKCANCGEGKTINRSLFDASSSKLFFCDRSCKEEQQTVGGLLALPHYGDGSYRKAAMDKYGAKCSACGITGNHLLVVHHVDGDRENNSVNNLVVLCHNHHANRHKKLLNGEYVLDYKQLWGN